MKFQEGLRGRWLAFRFLSHDYVSCPVYDGNRYEDVSVEGRYKSQIFRKRKRIESRTVFRKAVQVYFLVSAVLFEQICPRWSWGVLVWTVTNALQVKITHKYPKITGKKVFLLRGYPLAEKNETSSLEVVAIANEQFATKESFDPALMGRT